MSEWKKDQRLGCCFDKKKQVALIECDYCHDWLHYDCLEEEDGYSKKELKTYENNNKKFMCSRCECDKMLSELEQGTDEDNDIEILTSKTDQTTSSKKKK
eukprot:316152_1